MRIIPQDIKTLLKSRSMVGDNSPSAEVTFTDKVSGYSEPTWNTAHNIRGGASGTYYGGGSFAERKDGKVLVTYEHNTDIMLSVVDSEDDLFFYNNRCETYEWVFYTRYSANIGSIYTNSMLQKLSSGKILLYINENGVHKSADKPNKLMVYESSDGLGDDFVLKATIRNFSLSAYTDTIGKSYLSVGQPIQLENGRILVPFGGVRDYGSGYGLKALYCGYSDDGGAKWTVSVIAQSLNSCISYMDIRGIGRAGSQLISMISSNYSQGNTWLKYSNDNGTSWNDPPEYYTQKIATDMIYSHVFWGNGEGYTYMLYYNAVDNGYWIYRHNDSIPIDFTGQTPYHMGAIGSGATWEGPVKSTIMGDDLVERLYITEAGHMAFLGTSNYATYKCSYVIGGIREEITSKIPVSSIRISREAAAVAQRCSIEFPNVDPLNPKNVGYYLPYTDGEWKKVIMPGGNIKVRFGYGTQMVDAFTGQIDEATFSANPDDYNVALDCRDMACLLIDKYVTDVSGNYYLTYQNKTIEYITRNLLQRAGFLDSNIYTESTGIIIVRKTFERVTYADALEWCMNISGFDLIIDEEGKTSFHYPTDRQPAVTNEEVTLSGTTQVNLSNSNLVLSSQIVTSADGTVIYIKDVDYTIDYDNGVISRTVSSSIPDGGAAYINYVYAAYVFREGEDLFYLPLKLSRNNVYGKIRVVGRKADDTPCIGTFTLTNPADYGVDDEKVLFSEDQDIDTNEKAQITADQLGNDMIRHFREVSFSAVAVPWLQIGDCIKIIESSSKTSDIYRITSLDFDFSADGFIMQASAYQYGYGPL